MNQLINLDMLQGVIRYPIQQEEVVGRALRGSVCSLPIYAYTNTRGPLYTESKSGHNSTYSARK